MSAGLKILSAGPSVTLQDAGRRGYLRFGVTEAGPMDYWALATANAAVGAPPGAAAIEVSLGGMEVVAEGAPIPVAIAGGAFSIAMDGDTLPAAVRLVLEPGARLSIRAGRSGAWCYLAVHGGFDVPPVLGSNATHMRSGIGGFRGRALQAGDVVPVRMTNIATGVPEAILAPWLDRGGDVIRVIFGPQADYFAEDQIRQFTRELWKLSNRSDRMAYILDGRPLSHAKGFNIVSDGIGMGAIQVPGEGRPVVLMADRQPTGGYPKIATVIGADLAGLAQLRPGAQLRFTAVTIDEAVQARRAQADAFKTGVRCEPIIRRQFTSEFLLSRNLIAGVTTGRSEVPD